MLLQTSAKVRNTQETGEQVLGLSLIWSGERVGLRTEHHLQDEKAICNQRGSSFKAGFLWPYLASLFQRVATLERRIRHSKLFLDWGLPLLFVLFAVLFFLVGFGYSRHKDSNEDEEAVQNMRRF